MCVAKAQMDAHNAGGINSTLMYSVGDAGCSVIGLGLLWHSVKRGVAQESGRVLIGAMLSGWGLFNVVAGIINHQLLSMHHVREYARNHLPADMAFLHLVGYLFFSAGC